MGEILETVPSPKVSILTPGMNTVMANAERQGFKTIGLIEPAAYDDNSILDLFGPNSIDDTVVFNGKLYLASSEPEYALLPLSKRVGELQNSIEEFDNQSHDKRQGYVTGSMPEARFQRLRKLLIPTGFTITEAIGSSVMARSLSFKDFVGLSPKEKSEPARDIEVFSEVFVFPDEVMGFMAFKARAEKVTIDGRYFEAARQAIKAARNKE